MVVKRKIRASSLIEVILASVIMTVVFTASLYLIGQVTSSSTGTLRLEAEMAINSYLSDHSQFQINNSESIKTGNLRTSVTMNSYPGHQEIIEVRFKSFDSQSKLIHSKTILRKLK